ncbi:transcriptional regulator [Agrobacterium salinitolerans]|nr:transcriptional regulator [Agrobacterium salinitolerans]
MKTGKEVRRMKETQRDQVLTTLIVNQIMSNPLTGESGSSRLKQVALMMVIYVFLHGGEGQVGLSDLIKVTGLTRGGIIETIEPLVRRGLLVETMGKNSIGRGTARYFEIASSVKTIVAAVSGAPMGAGLE